MKKKISEMNPGNVFAEKEHEGDGTIIGIRLDSLDDMSFIKQFEKDLRYPIMIITYKNGRIKYQATWAEANQERKVIGDINKNGKLVSNEDTINDKD